MGQIHNELRRGYLGTALKLAIGDTKSEGGLERFSETLQPSIDLWSRPDWAMLRGEELWGAAVFVAAGGAGTFSKAGVFNPTTNLLVVVTHHLVLPAVQANVDLGTNTTVLTNTQTVINRDRRRPFSRGAVSQWEASAGVSVNTFHFAIPGPGGTQTWLELPVVLPPGQGIIWRSQDDNATLTASFIGYQRVALPGELL